MKYSLNKFGTPVQSPALASIRDPAYFNCIFYKNRFNKEHVHPNDINSFNDFLTIPILKKVDIHQYSRDYVLF